MSATTTTTTQSTAPRNDNYPEFLHTLQNRFMEAINGGELRLFATDASGLFDAYLSTIPAEHRQHYTCSCCRAFVNRFGGLVTIDPLGNTTPALWAFEVKGIHSAGVAAMARLVRRATVKGPFLSTAVRWGDEEAGGFNHMHVTPPASRVFVRTSLTAGQAMAAKREDFRTVERALVEFSAEHVKTALNVLESDQLYSAEKVIGPAKFLHQLHTDRAAANGSQAKDNVLWRAIASAPDGFCHPRSSMVGTLLEDIAAGKSFDVVARSFKDKMHPLRYQRPQAAPTAGNVAQAEKLFEQMGLAPALERRIARLDEVPMVWVPAVAEQPPAGAGVFGHVKTKDATEAAQALKVPAITMTLRKFVGTVMPTAEEVHVKLPRTSVPFIVVTTAVNEDAPRLFQWEHPFAWYVWHGGAPASQYGLQPDWVKVAGITRLPARFNDDEAERFTHHGDGIVLLLDGAKETRQAGAALFPSLMRSELHGVRATIEAHSSGAHMGGFADGTAIGYDLRKEGCCQALLRVKSDRGVQEYMIDRWD